MTVESLGYVDSEESQYLFEIDKLSERDADSKTDKVARSHILPIRHDSSFKIVKKPFSSTPIDVTLDVQSAISNARSGNWTAAVSDSLDFAEDLMELSQKTAEELIKSRTEAVQGDYAENSDVGFQ